MQIKSSNTIRIISIITLAAFVLTQSVPSYALRSVSPQEQPPKNSDGTDGTVNAMAAAMGGQVRLLPPEGIMVGLSANEREYYWALANASEKIQKLLTAPDFGHCLDFLNNELENKIKNIPGYSSRSQKTLKDVVDVTTLKEMIEEMMEYSYKHGDVEVRKDISILKDLFYNIAQVSPEIFLIMYKIAPTRINYFPVGYFAAGPMFLVYGEQFRENIRNINTTENEIDIMAEIIHEFAHLVNELDLSSNNYGGAVNEAISYKIQLEFKLLALHKYLDEKMQYPVPYFNNETSLDFDKWLLETRNLIDADSKNRDHWGPGQDQLIQAIEDLRSGATTSWIKPSERNRLLAYYANSEKLPAAAPHAASADGAGAAGRMDGEASSLAAANNSGRLGMAQSAPANAVAEAVGSARTRRLMRLVRPAGLAAALAIAGYAYQHNNEPNMAVRPATLPAASGIACRDVPKSFGEFISEMEKLSKAKQGPAFAPYRLDDGKKSEAGIYSLVFVNSGPLAEAFYRIGIFAEHKNKQGKIIKLGSAVDVSIGGYDFTAKTLAKFFTYAGLELSQKEKELLEFLLEMRIITKSSYGYDGSHTTAVLAWSADNSPDILAMISRHEIIHAVYFNHPGDFQNKIFNIWKMLSSREKKAVRRYLARVPYNLNDMRLLFTEFAAYFADGSIIGRTTGGEEIKVVCNKVKPLLQDALGLYLKRIFPGSNSVDMWGTPSTKANAASEVRAQGAGAYLAPQPSEGWFEKIDYSLRFYRSMHPEFGAVNAIELRCNGLAMYYFFANKQLYLLTKSGHEVVDNVPFRGMLFELANTLNPESDIDTMTAVTEYHFKDKIELFVGGLLDKITIKSNGTEFNGTNTINHENEIIGIIDPEGREIQKYARLLVNLPERFVDQQAWAIEDVKEYVESIARAAGAAPANAAAKAAIRSMLIITNNEPAARKEIRGIISASALGRIEVIYKEVGNSLSQLSTLSAQASGFDKVVVICFDDPVLSSAVGANLTEVGFTDLSDEAQKTAFTRQLGEGT